MKRADKVHIYLEEGVWYAAGDHVYRKYRKRKRWDAACRFVDLQSALQRAAERAAK